MKLYYFLIIALLVIASTEPCKPQEMPLNEVYQNYILINDKNKNDIFEKYVSPKTPQIILDRNKLDSLCKSGSEYYIIANFHVLKDRMIQRPRLTRLYYVLNGSGESDSIWVECEKSIMDAMNQWKFKPTKSNYLGLETNRLTFLIIFRFTHKIPAKCIDVLRIIDVIPYKEG